MATLNNKMISTSSMSTMRELDSFVKIYNKYRHLSERELKNAVVAEYDGLLTMDQFNRYLKMLKLYTREQIVPDPELWNTIKKDFKEIGNEKIVNAKKKLLDVREKKAQLAMLKAEKAKTSVYRAQEDEQKAERRVKLSKGTKTALSVGLGAIGAIGLPILLSSFFPMGVLAVSMMGLAGTAIGAYAGYAVGQSIENGSYKKLMEKRSIVDENDALIRELEAEIGRAEEEVKCLEDQYEIEIEKLVPTLEDLDNSFEPEPIVPETSIQSEEEHAEKEEPKVITKPETETISEKESEIKAESEKSPELSEGYKEEKATNMTGDDILAFVEELTADAGKEPEKELRVKPGEQITEDNIDDFFKDLLGEDYNKGTKEEPKKEEEKTTALIESPEKEILPEVAQAPKEETLPEQVETVVEVLPKKPKRKSATKALAEGDKEGVIYLDETQWEDKTDEQTVVIPVTPEALAEIKNQLNEGKKTEIIAVEPAKKKSSMLVNSNQSVRE